MKPLVNNQSYNKVENLEISPDVTVCPDEGFTVIKADCKGSVKWLVISSRPVKYIPNDQNNTIIVGIPPSGSVTVIAVGLCDNKMTEFAKTIITVKTPDNDSSNVKLKQQPIKW